MGCSLAELHRVPAVHAAESGKKCSGFLVRSWARFYFCWNTTRCPALVANCLSRCSNQTGRQWTDGPSRDTHTTEQSCSKSQRIERGSWPWGPEELDPWGSSHWVQLTLRTQKYYWGNATELWRPSCWHNWHGSKLVTKEELGSAATTVLLCPLCGVLQVTWNSSCHNGVTASTCWASIKKPQTSSAAISRQPTLHHVVTRAACCLLPSLVNFNLGLNSKLEKLMACPYHPEDSPTG